MTPSLLFIDGGQTTLKMATFFYFYVKFLWNFLFPIFSFSFLASGWFLGCERTLLLQPSGLRLVNDTGSFS